MGDLQEMRERQEWLDDGQDKSEQKRNTGSGPTGDVSEREGA